MTTGSCILCGSVGKLSREHVFPDWLNRTLFLNKPMVMRTGQRPYINSTLAIRAKAICDPCNHVWSSNIETKASKLLAGPVLGRPTQFTNADMPLLALWTAKIAWLLHAADGRVPEPHVVDHLHWLREHEQPSQSTCIWLFHLPRVGRSKDMLASADAGAIAINRGGRELPFTLATVTVGELGFQIVAHDADDDEDCVMNHDPQIEPALTQIWPNHPELVDWPPAHSFSYDGVRLLGAFYI